MTYILENEQESNRLKRQDQISAYSTRVDCEGLNFNPQDVVLDAGCGAGIISLYLKQNFKFGQLHSCDYSELRLKQAEKYLRENNVHDVSYFQCDLGNIPKPDHHFTKIICRYVYEYLPDPLLVTKELYRVCATGGVVRLIDADGVVANLVTKNAKLTKMLELLTKSSLEKHHLDFYAGRRLYNHMKLAGFKNVDYQIQAMVFKGDDLVKERENYIERFTFARHILDATFGAEAESFIKLYLGELENEENLLFYNNFIVTGIK